MTHHVENQTFSVHFDIPRRGHSPQGPQRPQQPQDPEHAQDLGAGVRDERHQDVDDRNQHQHPVQNVPAAPQVGLVPETPAQSHDLDTDGTRSTLMMESSGASGIFVFFFCLVSPTSQKMYFSFPISRLIFLAWLIDFWQSLCTQKCKKPRFVSRFCGFQCIIYSARRRQLRCRDKQKPESFFSVFFLSFCFFFLFLPRIMKSGESF